MTIVNTGTMGIVFNFAPNFGTQAGVVLAGGAGAGMGPVSGLVYNYSTNVGVQAGVLVNGAMYGGSPAYAAC